MRKSRISASGSDRRSDDFLVKPIQRVSDAGLGDHLLLSHDHGWYDPALPGGGTPKPFPYLSESFLLKLRQAGWTSQSFCR
jgi:phosphotriesterase-related protein